MDEWVVSAARQRLCGANQRRCSRDTRIWISIRIRFWLRTSNGDINYQNIIRTKMENERRHLECSLSTSHTHGLILNAHKTRANMT